jgi:hypothetical protein
VTTRGRAATFAVQYEGFTSQAEAAFQRAVDIWAAHLDSDAPVRVQATFGELGENVLGSAGPRLLVFSPTGLPPGIFAETFYPFALADALAGFDLFPQGDDPDTPDVDESEDDPDTPYDEAFQADIVATFNSAFDDWYFGLDGDPPANQIDFVTVVLHELGHGLGFVGSGDVDDGVEDGGATPPNGVECTGEDGVGCYGALADFGGGRVELYPFVFDRFIEDGAGVALLDEAAYPNDSEALGDLLQSEDLFVDAPTVVRVNGGERPPIWAPAPFELGSSFSHWDEVIFSEGTPAALMTPSLRRGEAYLDPGSVTCAFFADMGWPLGEGCALLVGGEPPPPPVPDAFAVVRTGRNPFTSSTSFRVDLERDQRVEAALYDVLGRRVRTLFAGEADAGQVRLEVDGAALAPAVYVLVVTAESGERVLAVTRVR